MAKQSDYLCRRSTNFNKAPATSRTSIESIGSRLRMSICPDPIGRHRTGSVGPKMTTPDAPTAAARCATPESLATNAEASRAIAATVGKSRSFKTETPASRKIGSIDASAGPSMTTAIVPSDVAASGAGGPARGRLVSIPNSDANAANLSAGQFLAGLPLPGKITMRFETSHFDSSNTRAAAARSSAVGSRRASSSDASSPTALK